MSKVRVFESVADFIQYRRALSPETRVGFTPTMGALHAGHASLIAASKSQNDLSVVSIFVNPTQFNNAEDFKKYPKTFEQDLILVEQNGGDIILYPKYEELYADNYRYKVSESTFSSILCGAHRPGHFDGVLTVVMKLLNIVSPNKAYFGKKDYQQYLLIRQMAQTFFMNVDIVGCETVREKDGLAMSSRNMRLSPQGREQAHYIPQALKEFRDKNSASAFLKSHHVELEYFEEHYGRRFIAAYVEGTRLIDNVEI